MKLSKPQEVKGEPDDSEPVESEIPDVYHELLDKDMPLDEAVELNNQVVADPEGFGIATERRVRELEETVQQQQEQIEGLREVIEHLFEVMKGDVITEQSTLEWEEFDNGGV